MNEQITIKLERKADGTIVRADAKRRGRPIGSGDPGLKLTCQVTGKSRATNQNYLAAKAARVGVTVEEILANYVSKEGLKVLNGTVCSDPEDVSRRDLLVKLNGGTRQRTPKVTVEAELVS